MKDLCVIDIEGCLTINKGYSINTDGLSNIVGYCESARRGKVPPVVLCTGRPQPYAEAIIQMIDGFFEFPSIVENGCFLYYPIEDKLVPHPDLAVTINGMKKARKLAEDVVKDGKANFEPGKEVCLSLNPQGGYSVLELFELLEPLVEKSQCFITYSSSAVDITPAGINKASGIRFLSEKTNIPFVNMLGIGDTRGDFPMLELVGYPACPNNASDEVKELVAKRNGYIATAPNIFGVWDILRHN